MILDLIVILFIIILSYILCINNKNNNDCQITHIIIGLTVIVFYKLVRYYKSKQQIIINKNEDFTVSQSLNEFIEGKLNNIVNQNPNNLNDDKLEQYTNTMTDLIKELQKININVESEIPNADNNIETIGLENLQAYQQFQIDYLTKQIKNSQDIINSEIISKTTENYKPIKVFSSCVSNTDSSLTREQPINSDLKSLNPLQSVVDSPSTQKMFETNTQGSLNISDLLKGILN